MRLNVFFPTRSVQSCVDRPDTRIAIVVVLLPTLAAALGAFWLGFSPNAFALGVGLLKSIANWLVLGIIVYILAYLFKGRLLQGKFSGILSAVSLLWMVALWATLVGIVFVPFLFDAPVLDAMRAGATGALAPQQTGFEIRQLLDANPARFNFGLAAAGFGIGIALVLLSVYLLYVVFSDLLEKSRILTKLILVFASVTVWMNLAYFIAVF